MSRSSRTSSHRLMTVVLLFLALVTGLAALRWIQERDMLLPATASLLVLQGDATVTLADAGEAQLKAGQSRGLQRGDGVRTGPGATAKLTFPGGETTELGAETRLSLLELHQSSVSRTLVVVIALERGSTLTRIRHMLLQGMRFEIETPLATVSVRGTVFQCNVLANDHAYVAAYDGVVSVAMGESSVDLQAGQGLDVRLGQPLQPMTVSGGPAPEYATDATQQAPVAPGEAYPAAPTLTEREKILFPAVETPTLPGDEYGSYTVQAGDTLYSIARKHGVSWEAIWEANRSTLERPELLQVGQKLRIPPAP